MYSFGRPLGMAPGIQRVQVPGKASTTATEAPRGGACHFTAAYLGGG